MNADSLYSIANLLLQTAGGTANMLIVARTIDLPLMNFETLIKSHPLLTFLFLFSFAISATNSYTAAILSACIYFALESDDIIRVYYKKQKEKVSEGKMILKSSPNVFKLKSNPY